MSDATYEAMEAAIRAHAADTAEGMALVTDWYLVTAYVTEEEGATAYQHDCSVSPLHTQLGLMELGLRRLRNEGAE